MYITVSSTLLEMCCVDLKNINKQLFLVILDVTYRSFVSIIVEKHAELALGILTPEADEI